MALTVEDANLERLRTLTRAVEQLAQKKVAAQTEVELLQRQYQEQVAQLEKYGITDVKNLPQVLASLDAEIQQKFAEAESRVAELETQMSQ
jgi:hypothetical protein